MLDSIGKGSVPLGSPAVFITPSDEYRHQDGFWQRCLLVNPHLDAAPGSGPVHTGQELADRSATTAETPRFLHIVEILNRHFFIDIDLHALIGAHLRRFLDDSGSPLRLLEGIHRIYIIRII